MGAAWREAMHRPLGEVFSFRNEIVHPKDRPTGRCTFVGLEHVESNTGLRIGSQSVLLEELSGRRARFKRGDIVYGYLRPYLNKVWVAEFDGICSVDQYVLKVGSNIDPSYLSHYLRSTNFLQAAPVNDSPGQLPRIRSGELTQTPIPLPPIDEQRRIAAILDQADAVRRKRQEAIATLVGLATSSFNFLFGDPVTNPKEWPILQLGEVGELERGISKHRPRNDPALLGGKHPLIQTGNIANACGVLKKFSATYSDLGLKQSRVWPRGTLCITIAANIGKTAILDFDACFPDSVVGFSPGSSITSAYVQYWMESIQERLEAAAPVSAQKNINLAILRALPIPVPSMELQLQFEGIVREVRHSVDLQRDHANKLNSMFASLQHGAFNGQLTAKRTERELAEVG